MCTSREPDTICLNVAIDHRIRALFQPVRRVAKGENGDHISTITALGHEITHDDAETLVTGQLAEPETTGGLAVILQQPRNDHPFKQGLEAVIEDCPTFSALDELLYTVSCGTISLKDVSVFDLLPFTAPKDIYGAEDYLRFLRKRFGVCVQAVCQKRPDVVLCAGKYRLPDELDRESCNRCKGEAWKLESLGIGRTFKDCDGRDYTNVRVYDATGNYTRIHRVNAFHPSAALHYSFQHHSRFRQLLLLAVSEACGAYVGNWTESSWMDDLREACAKRSEELRANCEEFSSDGNGFESDFEDDSDSESTDSLRDEGERVVSHYCSSLNEIVKAIRTIAMSHGDPYERLLNSLLTTRLNDASLALRYMHHLENEYDWSMPELLVSVTCNLIEQDFAAYEWSGSEAIKQETLGGVRELASCVSRSEYVDVEKAVEVFLHTAEALERILGDIMERRRWRLLHEELAGIDLEFEC